MLPLQAQYVWSNLVLDGTSRVLAVLRSINLQSCIYPPQLTLTSPQPPGNTNQYPPQLAK